MGNVIKLNQIVLPFVKVNILKLQGQAETLEMIPEYIVTPTCSLKDVGGSTPIEYGLSFEDILLPHDDLKNYQMFYLQRAIEFHILNLATNSGLYNNKQTTTFDLSRGEMDRIQDLVWKERRPDPIKVAYTYDGKPTVQFGLGADIAVHIRPEFDLKLSVQKISPFNVLFNLASEEPVIDGSIVINDEKMAVYVWRRYNNKLFYIHANRLNLIEEISKVLEANYRIVQAVGSWGQLNLSMGNKTSFDSSEQK